VETTTNDAGFSIQHDIRRAANGDLSIFDNQFSPSNGARDVQYSLDTAAITVTKTVELGHLFPFPAYSLGSCNVLDNDYSIVGWENTRHPIPSVTLVDRIQNIAADIYFEDIVVTYRASSKLADTAGNHLRDERLLCDAHSSKC
jgi:hypothetical protein